LTAKTAVVRYGEVPVRWCNCLLAAVTFASGKE
jgi:hypothetical protein